MTTYLTSKRSFVSGLAALSFPLCGNSYAAEPPSFQIKEVDLIELTSQIEFHSSKLKTNSKLTKEGVIDSECGRINQFRHHACSFISPIESSDSPSSNQYLLPSWMLIMVSPVWHQTPTNTFLIKELLGLLARQTNMPTRLFKKYPFLPKRL